MAEHAIGTGYQFVDQQQACEICVREIDRQGEGISTIKRLRDQIGDELFSISLTCARLQSKAISKLGPAAVREDGEPGIWWVTDQSLQQATPWQVARYKAGWLNGVQVADLCCGIGGDSMQVSRQASITAVDADPLIAAMAKANLAQGQAGRRVQVFCQDATTFSLPVAADLHIDPDRRSRGRRSSDPREYEPSWDAVLEMIRSLPAVVKLAPMANLPSELLPHPHHRCWISLQRTVREQSLLCGEMIDRHQLQPGGRSAVAISADANVRTFTPEEDLKAGSVSTPLGFLIDPDSAIRAAALTESFAAHQGLQMLGGPSGFLTTDDPPLQSTAELLMGIIAPVVWWGACDMKKIRKELRTRNAHAVTAKVRGTGHDPAKILKPLRNTGEQPLTLWIGRSDDRVYAALTEIV
ncbi:MAG: hypothetical protein P8L85_18055 [Rubripirellula sp.]|nr:hypothetical protein [Rubripirellula sp.]